MNWEQEEALYEFLENAIEPFTANDVISYIKTTGQKNKKRLSIEITAYLDERRLAFRQDSRRWVSRRACFEPVPFVITPTRLELLNGILIPGHRCAPFAHPLAMPHVFRFYWKGKPIPVTTTEAPPGDLYPYYCIYGEEFAPQYIARENPENEDAYNADPYEDPVEVSILTLDMRVIYREASFVPGDRFIVRTINWKECLFELEKAKKEQWVREDLEKWVEAAESGFENSFALLGPGASTEEQIAFAYWFGGKRMRDIPALSLEEFLYERTDKIETVPYGIETRLWFAGKEIPDCKNLQPFNVPPDRTFIEELLFKKNIPISEFVILSYVRDAFYRNEKDIEHVIDRVVPPIVPMEEAEWDIIADYLSDAMDDFYKGYTLFLDQDAGPVRRRVAELHTAVIELAAGMQKGEIETAWLPRHTFIVLSQIQGHAAALLEDLAFNEPPSKAELTAIDNSLDGMIETYSDVKELIKKAMDSFRRSNLTIIHGGKTSGQLFNTIQISISGLNVWRRAMVLHDCTLGELHTLIQIGMNWEGKLRFRFYIETPDGEKQFLHDKLKLNEVKFRGKKEIVYEYGPKWIIKIIIMSSYRNTKDDIARFVAGDGAAPPEHIEDLRRFDKTPAVYHGAEKQSPLQEPGTDFYPGTFDLDKINRNLRAALSGE